MTHMIQAGSATNTALARQEGIVSLVRGCLLFYLVFCFSDGVNFVAFVSPYLLYAIYAAVFGSIAIALLCAAADDYWFGPVIVYGAWLIFYFVWTLLVAPDAREQLPEVIRVLVRDATVLAPLPIVLRDRRDITKLASWMQLVVLVNCAICVWESADSNVIWAIAAMRAEDLSVVDPNRAAGLWYNPNPAAFGFLLGALVSHWARGWLVWAGRIAALVGIYLTVSRSGLYMLLLCGGLYALFRLRHIHLSVKHWLALAGALALLVGSLIWVVDAGPAPALAGGDANWNIQRLLDVQEENSGDLSRVQLSEVALRAALRGPWYGRGTFAFQGSDDSPFRAYTTVGAHNLYIVVLGEAGLPGVAVFLALLVAGLWQTIRMPADDRFVLWLLWLVFFFIGLVNHNQFTSFQGALYAGLLAHMPIAARPRLLMQTYEPVWLV